MSWPSSSRHSQLPPFVPGAVQPGLVAEPEHVLHLDDRETRLRRESQPDQRPVGLGILDPRRRQRRGGTAAEPWRSGIPPAPERAVVVCSGVDDAVLGIVLEGIRVGRTPGEAELEHAHPGRPDLVAQPANGRRDHAEVLDDDRDRSERDLGCGEQLASRASPPVAGGGGRAGADRPAGDEAAEMVDAGQVGELEGMPETLDPPAVSLGAMRGPGIERIAPVLAERIEVVRRRACLLAAR